MLGLLLGTLVVGVWCVGAAVGLGFRLGLRLAPRGGVATQMALGFLLGTALLAYAVLGLGLLDGLRPLPVLGLLVGLSIPAVWAARRIGARLAAMGGDLAAAYRAGGRLDRILIALAGLLTSLSLVVPLLPVTSADALAYATAVTSGTSCGRDPLFPAGVLGLVSHYQLRHHEAWIASVYNEASGYGRSVSDLVLWWLRASILPIRGSGSYIGTFALTFLPLALLARPRAPRLTAVALGFGAATVALFVLSGQFERYFLAPLAAMTLLAVAGWEAQREARRAVHWTGFALLLVLGLLATLPLKTYGLIVHVPALASREAEERLLGRTTPWYADLRQMRTLVPADQPILCLLRNCQYLVNHRREDVLYRLVEAGQDSGGIDPRRVRQGLRAEGIRYVAARELTGEGPDAILLDLLARAGGRVIYRNPAARFGTRDPRRVDTSVVVLIELEGD
jgi:hypothetical protein